jgi:hypothetical protein|tara:strand:+ start:736 stop:873 length:138 start_codon:yes stop_codon:yes gene_type:complete
MNIKVKTILKWLGITYVINKIKQNIEFKKKLKELKKRDPFNDSDE